MAYIAVLCIAVPSVPMSNMHVLIGHTNNCTEYWKGNVSGHIFTHVSLNAIWYAKYFAAYFVIVNINWFSQHCAYVISIYNIGVCLCRFQYRRRWLCQHL